MSALTLLSHPLCVLVKRWRADGTITPYDHAKIFSVSYPLLEHISDLSALLTRLELDPHTCVIRGSGPPNGSAGVRRKLVNFHDIPIHPILIEVDGYEPLGADPLTDPAGCCEEYIRCSLPPSFQDVSFHWQLSNSAGHSKHTGILKVHLWFWLETPYTSLQLKHWAKTVALPCDHAVFNPIQIHYTGAPLFDPGVVDPVPHRSGYAARSHASVLLTIDPEILARAEASVRPHPSGEAGEVDDPVAAFLRRVGRVVGQTSDRLYVQCPWESGHSSGAIGDTSSAWLLAGSGDYSTGHYKCLHQSCGSRSDREFEDVIGYLTDGFVDERTVVDHTPLSGFVQEGDAAVPVATNPLDLPRFDRQPKTNKIKPHLNNLVLFMEWLCQKGEGVRFDVFQDEIRLMTPTGERSFTDADYTRLQMRAEQGLTGFAPLTLDLLRRAVHMVAQNRCFDSAQEWLATLPAWDGVPRVEGFCATYLGASPSLYATAVSRYLWSAMPGRIACPGIQADMSVILVSAQGTGKSSSIRAMAPIKEYYIDLSLSDRDADLSRLTRGKTVVELAELRGLHTKEMDSIKSFATRLESEWVPKYFEMRTVYLRRFLMIGTTNNDEFLGDATGERRWLPIRVGRQDIEAIQRDHQQLWAEGVALYQTEGICWREAQRLAEYEHAEFSVQDVWVDELGDWLHRDEFGRRPIDCDFLLMKDVLRDGLGLDTHDGVRANQLRVGDAMKRLGYKRIQKWVDGRNQKVWVKNLSASIHQKHEEDRDLL